MLEKLRYLIEADFLLFLSNVYFPLKTPNKFYFVDFELDFWKRF